jgi:uncharacterized OsmC-like protein
MPAERAKATEPMITTQTEEPRTGTDNDRINGVNMPALRKLVEDVGRDPQNAATTWGVKTHWAGGAASETQVAACDIGGRRVRKEFTIRVDEPLELAGTNTEANPQEYLLAAFNSCMMVGYVAQASLRGIHLEAVEIESKGDIDLRGFLGLSPHVNAGYDSIRYTVRLKGDGTKEQFEEIHRAVMATSPNRSTLATPVRLDAELVVE